MLFCDKMKNFESTLKRFADPYSVARDLSDELSTTPVRWVSSSLSPSPSPRKPIPRVLISCRTKKLPWKLLTGGGRAFMILTLWLQHKQEHNTNQFFVSSMKVRYYVYMYIQIGRRQRSMITIERSEIVYIRCSDLTGGQIQNAIWPKIRMLPFILGQNKCNINYLRGPNTDAWIVQ